MTKLYTVAEMTGREIFRRRGVLVLLLTLPLAFYLARRTDHSGQAVRFVLLGVSWAVSVVALFAGSASRAIEPRLRLSGYRSHQLYLGRLAALWGIGAVLSVPYTLLVAVDQDAVRSGAVAVAMLLGVAVAAPLGLLLSAVLPRELEGTLALLIVIGLQMIIDPSATVARSLPFWSSREIATYAVDHVDSGYLERGVLHGLGFMIGLTVLVAVISTLRLRRRPHLRVMPIQ